MICSIATLEKTGSGKNRELVNHHQHSTGKKTAKTRHIFSDLSMSPWWIEMKREQFQTNYLGQFNLEDGNLILFFLSKCMIHTESCSSMSQVQISVNSGLSGQIIMFRRPTQFNTIDWTKGRSSSKGILDRLNVSLGKTRGVLTWILFSLNL